MLRIDLLAWSRSLWVLGTDKLVVQCRIAHILYAACAKAPSSRSALGTWVMLEPASSQQPINDDQGVQPGMRFSINTPILSYTTDTHAINWMEKSCFTLLVFLDSGTGGLWEKITRIQVVWQLTILNSCLHPSHKSVECFWPPTATWGTQKMHRFGQICTVASTNTLGVKFNIHANHKRIISVLFRLCCLMKVHV